MGMISTYSELSSKLAYPTSICLSTSMQFLYYTLPPDFGNTGEQRLSYQYCCSITKPILHYRNWELKNNFGKIIADWVTIRDGFWTSSWFWLYTKIKWQMTHGVLIMSVYTRGGGILFEVHQTIWFSQRFNDNYKMHYSMKFSCRLGCC